MLLICVYIIWLNSDWFFFCYLKCILLLGLVSATTKVQNIHATLYHQYKKKWWKESGFGVDVYFHSICFIYRGMETNSM